ncbi:MAG: hypothetical protein QOF52_2809, partial [Propionibacteriaceae bacterium]|nr:hypothetical protein [Propionibacteriaceae bacterium]
MSSANGNPAILAPGNPMRVVLLTMLIFEVILFGLAVPVMIFVSDVSGGVATALGGAGILLALVAAGLMRKPIGCYLGWLTQVVAVALGLVTPAMFAVGGMFGLLWVITFILGKR